MVRLYGLGSAHWLRVLLKCLVAQRQKPIALRRPERIAVWRESPDLSALVVVVKIADTPCQLIFFELYSKIPNKKRTGFACGLLQQQHFVNFIHFLKH